MTEGERVREGGEESTEDFSLITYSSRDDDVIEK
jgi:hypothetical protein